MQKARDRYHSDRPFFIAKQRAYRRAVREEALRRYGGCCQCCGETRYEFLALDHPQNDGKAHRRELGVGIAFYLALKKQGYPPGLRVLCHNCNMARGLYVECPHQAAKHDGRGQADDRGFFEVSAC